MLDRSLKRASQDEPIFLDEQLYNDLEGLVKKIAWPYRSARAHDLITRDHALFAFLILTGLRISEALEVRRKQLRIYDNRIEAANIKTIKRGNTRKKIILPKIGALKGLTYTFEAWLNMIDSPEAYLFPAITPSGFDYSRHINRHRAYQVIALSGKFPHWARAVCETIYGRKIFLNDAWKLKEFMGLRRLDSTAPYVSGSWEDDEKNVFRL